MTTMFLQLFAMIDAFTMQQSTTRITSTSTTTSLYETPISSTDRRLFVSILVGTSIAITSSPLPAFASEKDTLITNLSDSLTAIKAIPSLVDSAEWDKIRTVLKTPPVNELWNLASPLYSIVLSCDVNSWLLFGLFYNVFSMKCWLFGCFIWPSCIFIWPLQTTCTNMNHNHITSS